MLCNEQRTGTKKKTHVKKKTLNPVFNESFIFDLPQHLEGVDDGGSGGSEGGAETIKNISFEFQLLDWDRVTKNEVRTGTNSARKRECLSARWSVLPPMTFFPFRENWQVAVTGYESIEPIYCTRNLKRA